MKNLTPLAFNLLTISTDTCKVYLKNGRLMALIAIMIISIQTMLFLFNVFSIKPLMADLIIKQSFLLLTTPGTPEFIKMVVGLYNDIKMLFGLESVFLFINLIVSFFLAITTIHASASIHLGKTISIKDLGLKIVRSLKRPFLTCFYITLLSLGYIFLCFLTLLPIGLTIGNGVSSILVTISAMVFYTYLSVAWNLSIVISTLEEKYGGMEALGKAAQIVKGMKLVGFVLNVGIAIISLILIQCSRSMMINLKQSEAMGMVVGLVVVNSLRMVNMLGYTANTVFYFECKKGCGEEVELQPEMEYTKIPIVPIIGENIP